MEKLVNLKVVGPRTMHCGGCENNVKFTLSQLPGVIGIAADRLTQLIKVSLVEDKTDFNSMQSALVRIGYQVELA